MSHSARLTREQAASLLYFYADAGLVDLLDDQPVDRYDQTAHIIAQQKARKSQGQTRLAEIKAKSDTSNNAPSLARAQGAAHMPQSVQKTSATKEVAVPDQAAIHDAKALAKSAHSLDQLRNIVAQFQGCNLKTAAKNTVFSDGNPQAPIMLVGEAPGRDEDRQGRPFVGRAGQLLDKMLSAIALDRNTCYITNVIPWRPPGNRTPVAHEIELCRPFVERHIELVDPKLLIFMGNVSNKTLLNTNKGILSMRGTWSSYQIHDRHVPTLSMLHPAYLLRNPAAKRNAWMDLLAVKAKIQDLSL